MANASIRKCVCVYKAVVYGLLFYWNTIAPLMTIIRFIRLNMIFFDIFSTFSIFMLCDSLTIFFLLQFHFIHLTNINWYTGVHSLYMHKHLCHRYSEYKHTYIQWESLLFLLPFRRLPINLLFNYSFDGTVNKKYYPLT